MTFLNALQNKSAQLTQSREPVKTPENKPILTVEPLPKVSPTPKETPLDEPTDVLTIYRRQVDELLEELKIPAGDLILVAIDLLHKTTFSKDS